MRWWMAGGLVSALVLASGCSDTTPAGPTVRLDFAASLGANGEVFAAPLPSDHRLDEDGIVDLAGFPNRDAEPISRQILEVLDGRARHFSATAGIFFTLETAVDEALLPDAFASITDDAAVYLMAVDATSPDYLTRHPIDVRFLADAGPYGARNMLVALPLQGRPLRAGTRYAAVVTGRLGLPRTTLVQDLEAGRAPAGLTGAALTSYQTAAAALTEAGLLADAVALTTFTVGDSTSELVTLNTHAHELDTPTPVDPIVATDEVFDDFCVFEGVLEMPVYQNGEAPYSDSGGEIVFGANGPEVDHLERARIVVTIPRGPMPAGGWPTAVMIRTGGGGDRPLVDRGVHAEPGGAAPPGTGPALEFARAGFAGVSVDGPHGGLRNVTDGDEQFLMFNVTNAYALRDNVRQSALEIALIPEILDGLSFDTSACPDASPTASFDTSKLALFGHSTGAWIAPHTLAITQRFGAAILSGAGASWIANVVHKLSPLEVRPLADILVGYTGSEFSLHEHDPILSMLQWAVEPSDVSVYGGLAENLHVLVIHGIVDTYILPPIANPSSLSLGLDLGGPELDRDHPDLAKFRPLTDTLSFGGRGQLAYPIEGNHDGSTRVVVQHVEDDVEDGHETAFQTEPPKEQYRCFLSSWLTNGTPTVVEPGQPCE